MTKKSKVTRSLSKNLAEPLTMTEQEAIFFCRDNVCSDCFGTLQRQYQGWDKYIIQCVMCKRVIYDCDYISKEAADQVKANRAVGEMELSDHEETKNKTTDQILKELGF